MTRKFNPHDYPICFSQPLRIAPHYWARHIPFAMFLVDILRPKVFVELGTYYGVSYCAFCQAVKELSLETRCYGIDTWQGDGITWSYTSDVLDDLRQHHDPLYGSFSRLTQSTFDEALENFRDQEIDLLHIDGYHPYESVKHDFESWLPKMSKRGVVLFHDINVRQAGYGVWKLWDEVTQSYPHFEIWHEHGLGVLAVGPDVPEIFKELLLEQNEQSVKEIRNFFFHMGDTWKPLFDAKDTEKKNGALKAENDALKAENDALKAENENLKTNLRQLRLDIRSIQDSDTFRFANMVRLFFEKLAPGGTSRRGFLTRMKKLLLRRPDNTKTG